MVTPDNKLDKSRLKPEVKRPFKFQRYNFNGLQVQLQNEEKEHHRNMQAHMQNKRSRRQEHSTKSIANILSKAYNLTIGIENLK